MTLNLLNFVSNIGREIKNFRLYSAAWRNSKLRIVFGFAVGKFLNLSLFDYRLVTSSTLTSLTSLAII